eukprot:sb/3468442/
MLDELMGKDRDMTDTEREKGALHWSDSNVCKYYLVKFCPHDLFTNTRADLGTCKYPIHDQKIREVYRTSQRYKTMGYEAMMLRFLEGIVEDMEKKIRKQHERLEHDERYMKQEQDKMDEGRMQKLEDLDKKIDMLLEKMSQAGAEGNVDQAQHMMKDVDFFRQEREKLKNAKVEEPQRKVFLVKQNVPFINEMKHMEVCTTCGAFLVVNDTQTRVDAHLAGKQHVGYTLIRETIKEIKEMREKEQKELDEKRAARRAARE